MKQPFQPLLSVAARNRYFVTASLFLILVAALAAQPASIVLVENGPRATVIVAPNASADEKAAAQELIYYVEKATGARLPMASSPSGDSRILVGPSACPAPVRENIRRLRGDGFLAQAIQDGTVMLAGNGRYGTSFAVYAFLQSFLGVRWLWPGELGEVVPRRSTLQVPSRFSIRQEPAYLWRDLGPGGALWGSMDKWTAERKLGVSEEHQRLEQLWEKRTGFGGLRFYGGHAFGEILPPAKYGPGHPEYFAQVGGKRVWARFDGKHGAQPCTSNPEVVRLTADYVERFFRDHPDYGGFSISLNDGGGFCECDRCRRLDSGAVETGQADPEGGKAGRRAVITDRIVTFANQVADAVSRTHPGKKLILFAYGPYKQPPARVKPHPNLIIQYTFQASLDWNPAEEERQYRETGAWSRAAQDLGIYEYFIQGNSPDLPRLMLEPIARSVRRLYEQGYRYYQTQAGGGYAINGLDYYVLSRLLWNPSLDPAGIESDYLETGFGKAAPVVKRYFDRRERQWQKQAGVPVGMDAATLKQYRRVAEAYPQEFRSACRADLEEAYPLVQGRERERVVFLQRGWHYVEVTLDAVEKTIPLLEAGWKLAPKVEVPAHADLKKFRLALSAWEERHRYVDTLQQDFVLSYLWIRYNDQNRRFVPLEPMQAYWTATHPRDNRPVAIRMAEEWRSEIKQAFFVLDPLPPLEPEFHGRFEPAPGLTAERITYGTEFGLRIPAIVYLPKERAGKIPALIVVNGHGGDKYSWYAFYTGVLYARAGAAVLTYDPIGEGERNINRQSETRAHDQVIPPPELAQRLAGLMMTDLMQAVSYLSQRPEVDAKRIAATGYSLGSFVVTLAGAVDRRIHACVPVGGGNIDAPWEYWDHTKKMCTGIPYQSLMFLGDRPAVIYALHAFRGPTLVFNGTADDVVAIPTHLEPFFRDLQQRVAGLLGASQGILEFGFEAGASHRPFFLTKPVALWLERHLDFPNWTETGIRAMPETHISEWAKANNVEMDRLYATEEREGGTRALGAGVPALSRETLSVFTPEEWERRKDRMIHESWLREAKARVHK